MDVNINLIPYLNTVLMLMVLFLHVCAHHPITELTVCKLQDMDVFTWGFAKIDGLEWVWYCLKTPGPHPELSGCITTLTDCNTGSCKLLCSNGHLDRSRCLVPGPGPSKNIWCHVLPYSFLCMQITRSDIMPHVKWAVSLVITDGYLIFPMGLVWVCMG